MEDIYGLDLGYAAGARTALEHLGRILREGERPLCGATGFLDGHTGLVLATTERLLFVHKDRTPVDDPYEDIVAFRARAGVIGAILQVQDKQGRITIKQIHPRDRLVDFAAVLQKGPEAYASAYPPAEAAGPSLKGQKGAVPRPAEAATPPLKTKGRAVPRPAVPAIRPRAASAGMPGPVPAPPTTTKPPPPAANAAAAAPADDGLLRPGEWIVGRFDEVKTAAEGGPVATLAITNRRLLCLDPAGETLRADWPLTVLDAQDTGPTRVTVSPGVEFDFGSQARAAEFSKELVTAGFIAAPPDQ